MHSAQNRGDPEVAEQVRICVRRLGATVRHATQDGHRIDHGDHVVGDPHEQRPYEPQRIDVDLTVHSLRSRNHLRSQEGRVSFSRFEAFANVKSRGWSHARPTMIQAPVRIMLCGFGVTVSLSASSFGPMRSRVFSSSRYFIRNRPRCSPNTQTAWS
eukprot:scaffold207_cov267-Pinguiococcus_pyrenoidosus.AAC.18